MMRGAVLVLAFALFAHSIRKHDHQCPRHERSRPVERMCIAKKPWRSTDRHEGEGIPQDLPPRCLCAGNYGQHRKSSPGVVVDTNERQCPEMRGRPEEDSEE